MTWHKIPSHNITRDNFSLSIWPTFLILIIPLDLNMLPNTYLAEISMVDHTFILIYGGRRPFILNMHVFLYDCERILIKSYPISSTMFVAVVAWCGRPKGDSLIMISRRKNKTRLPVPIMCCVKNVISIQSSTTRGSFIISYPTPSSKELLSKIDFRRIETR